MKSAALLQQLLYLPLLLASVLLRGAEARASSESELLCSPLVIEPYQNSSCVINVRDAQQEPTTAFDVGEFFVTAHSSVSKAALKVSPLRRDDDVTTVVFDISAVESTTITVDVMCASGGYAFPIHNSGLVVSVLTRAAVRMGPILCDVPAAGLFLSGTTTCRTALYDANNRRAVVYPSDVAFVEENNMGFFHFISGKGDLVFNFTAASLPSMSIGNFTLHLTLIGDTNTYSTTFPLLYPDLYPAASFSTLVCFNETVPIACIVRALGTMGPVRLNLDYFRITLEMLDEDSVGNKWVDNTNAFSISARALAQTDTAFFSCELKVNDAINLERLHVYIVTSAVGNERKKLQEVQGSPFVFVSGVRPNAAYVSLRGCKVPAITSGNRTQCFIDLYNGVTGDVRYFHLASTLGALFENITYLSMDPVFKAPVVTFVYVAPVLTTRLEDIITLFVDGQSAIRSPFRITVFPQHSPTSDESFTTVRGNNALVIGVGLAFFGVVIGTGSFVAVKRTLRFNRIRQLRVIRKTQELLTEEEEAAASSAVGKVGIEPVPQVQKLRESESD
ncbi:hypothetical protein TraAM80_00602 [Trypanosoma rangeli]|uniref:Ig-like domain-containing protein n=1 Tax=Trypanosoma rangeli TaxID=5698 RepID=A0A3R7N2S1_TRYRA|nr:uncharacterized protein TraAM80_00602 [Trypanosoma rangeli]RNF11907.1 hypothetical protein TraAM80_00602 [Trypanosoma rangeli]|eukprot:RNF11907.1 hypothetical protein TraAM80_00602 [Trypanosoma rangeli]